MNYLEKNITLKTLEKYKNLSKEKSKLAKFKKFFKYFIFMYKSLFNYVIIKKVNLNFIQIIEFFSKIKYIYIYINYINNWGGFKIKIFRSIKKRVKKKIIKKLTIKL